MEGVHLLAPVEEINVLVETVSQSCTTWALPAECALVGEDVPSSYLQYQSRALGGRGGGSIHTKRASIEAEEVLLCCTRTKILAAERLPSQRQRS